MYSPDRYNKRINVKIRANNTAVGSGIAIPVLKILHSLLYCLLRLFSNHRRYYLVSNTYFCVYVYILNRFGIFEHGNSFRFIRRRSLLYLELGKLLFISYCIVATVLSMDVDFYS